MFAAFLRRPGGAPACAEFDEAFYAAQNPDAVSPWADCQRCALTELRDPSPQISMAFVAKAYKAKPKRFARVLLKLFDARRGPRRKALPLLESELRANQARFREKIVLETLADGPKKHDSLVYVQTGGRHPRGLHDPARHYDLMLNYFTPPQDLPQADYIFHQGGTKVTAIATLLEQKPEALTQYEHVLFLDDDILLSPEQIDRFFAVMRAEKLDFAQPSLTPDSYGSFPVLYCRKDSPGFRRVNYVEIMAPALSRRALIAAKECFSAGISGFAVDSLIGATLRRQFGETVAVVDAVAAEHRRAIDLDGGALYRFLTESGIDPLVEMHVIEADAGLEHGLREI